MKYWNCRTTLNWHESTTGSASPAVAPSFPLGMISPFSKSQGQLITTAIETIEKGSQVRVAGARSAWWNVEHRTVHHRKGPFSPKCLC